MPVVAKRSKKVAFREAFQKHTHARKNKIKVPSFDLETIEDYYTYYVMILKIPEQLFWYADISFVKNVAENKSAYDGWLSSELERSR